MGKRAFERVTTNLKAEIIWSEALYPATVTNLSESGMYMNTIRCLPLDSRLEVLIPLKEETIKVLARVSRLVETKSFYDAMGVDLLNPPKNYLEFVGSLRCTPIKTYVCKVCGHIAFDMEPINCPVCDAPIENFEYNPDAIKIPEDPENLTDFEKRHTPVITVSKECSLIPGGECIDVHIKVGEIEHEMGSEDQITFIDFYYNSPHINKRCLTRVGLRCNKIHPVITLHLNKLPPGIITVIGNCNAHGNWMAESSL